MKKLIFGIFLLIPVNIFAQAGYSGGLNSSGGGGGGGAAGAPLTGTNSVVTADTPLINVSQTWNGAGVTFTGMKANITSTASSATSKFWDMQLAGTSQLSITKTGNIFVGTATNVGQYSFGPPSGTTTDIAAVTTANVLIRSSFSGGSGQGGSLYIGATDNTGFRLRSPASTHLWLTAGDNTAGVIEVHQVVVKDPAGATGGGLVIKGSNPAINNNAITVSSGFGTSPSIVTGQSGSFTFRVNVGTGGSATSGVLAFPTADTGWNCSVRNLTAAAGHRADDSVMTTSNTTTVTIENQTKSTGAAIAWTASDIVQLVCAAY
jgi:hypothetical protein